MKRRTEIILIGVVAVAAVFAMKRGQSECGSGGDGACCPLMSGLNTWPTNLPAGTNLVNTNSELAGSETSPNRQR